MRVGEIDQRPVAQQSIQELTTQPLFGQVTTAPDARKSLSRRSQLEIRMDMLAAVKVGSDKPTQIMYRANLSWNVLQAQLRSFLESGMLAVEEYGSRRRYLITPKGTEMVESYQKVVKEILR